jgi:hypothetical protein
MLGYWEWHLLEVSGGIYRVYHGGLWDGKRSLRVNSKGSLGVGAYFTADINRAKEYAKEANGIVVEVEIELKNPLIIEGKIEHPVVEGLVKLGMEESAAAEMVERVEERYGYMGEQLKNRALTQGYDGLIQLNRLNKSQISELVIWERNVIKSVRVV